MGGRGGGVEKIRLKLTSAKVEVEVEAELGNNPQNEVNTPLVICFIFSYSFFTLYVLKYKVTLYPW